MNSENWVGYDYPRGMIPEGKFDFITLWWVLEHLSNPVEIVKDLSSRLNEKGKIVMTTVGIDTGIPYNYRYSVHLLFWSNKSIEELFRKIGLQTKEISNYFMLQNPQFYLDRVLIRGKVPKEIKKMITINTKKDILVPTNEIYVMGEK